jgi:hypothetical protein
MCKKPSASGDNGALSAAHLAAVQPALLLAFGAGNDAEKEDGRLKNVKALNEDTGVCDAERHASVSVADALSLPVTVGSWGPSAVAAAASGGDASICHAALGAPSPLSCPSPCAAAGCPPAAEPASPRTLCGRPPAGQVSGLRRSSTPSRAQSSMRRRPALLAATLARLCAPAPSAASAAAVSAALLSGAATNCPPRCWRHAAHGQPSPARRAHARPHDLSAAPPGEYPGPASISSGRDHTTCTSDEERCLELHPTKNGACRTRPRRNMSAGTDAETAAAALPLRMGPWVGCGGLMTTRPELMFAFVSAIASSISMLLLLGEGGPTAQAMGGGAPPHNASMMFELGGISATGRRWAQSRDGCPCAAGLARDLARRAPVDVTGGLVGAGARRA